jgi:hypothetical protein
MFFNSFTYIILCSGDDHFKAWLLKLLWHLVKQFCLSSQFGPSFELQAYVTNDLLVADSIFPLYQELHSLIAPHSIAYPVLQSVNSAVWFISWIIQYLNCCYVAVLIWMSTILGETIVQKKILDEFCINDVQSSTGSYL